jgi:hypothetical protein
MSEFKLSKSNPNLGNRMYVAKESAAVRQKISTSKANTLRQRAVDVVQQETKKVLELAEVLWETWAFDVKVNGVDTALWTAWDHDTWEEYVEVELGIHMTTAANFRRMHEVYNIDLKGAIEDASMEGISYTKLKILTRVATKKNVNAWLRKAKKISCCALEEEVAHVLYGDGKVGAVHTLAILCTKREQKRMRDIIMQYQSDNETRRPGAALLAILEEWNTIKNRVARRQKKAG